MLNTNSFETNLPSKTSLKKQINHKLKLTNLSTKKTTISTSNSHLFKTTDKILTARMLSPIPKIEIGQEYQIAELSAKKKSQYYKSFNKLIQRIEECKNKIKPLEYNLLYPQDTLSPPLKKFAKENEKKSFLEEKNKNSNKTFLTNVENKEKVERMFLMPKSNEIINKKKAEKEIINKIKEKNIKKDFIKLIKEREELLIQDENNDNMQSINKNLIENINKKSIAIDYSKYPKYELLNNYYKSQKDALEKYFNEEKFDKKLIKTNYLDYLIKNSNKNSEILKTKENYQSLISLEKEKENCNEINLDKFKTICYTNNNNNSKKNKFSLSLHESGDINFKCIPEKKEIINNNYKYPTRKLKIKKKFFFIDEKEVKRKKKLELLQKLKYHFINENIQKDLKVYDNLQNKFLQKVSDKVSLHHRYYNEYIIEPEKHKTFSSFADISVEPNVFLNSQKNKIRQRQIVNRNRDIIQRMVSAPKDEKASQKKRTGKRLFSKGVLVASFTARMNRALKKKESIIKGESEIDFEVLPKEIEKFEKEMLEEKTKFEEIKQRFSQKKLSFEEKQFINYIKKNDCEKVIEMLQLNPDLINLKDNINATPLHFAAKRGNGKVIDILIEWGADLGAVDITNRAAKDYAKMSDYKKIYRDLKFKEQTMLAIAVKRLKNQKKRKKKKENELNEKDSEDNEESDENEDSEEN